MTDKCTKCKKFITAECKSGICPTCETAIAMELAESMAKETKTNELPNNNTPTAPNNSTPVFKFEVPTYIPGQQGGIRTWLRQVEIRLKLAKILTEEQRYEYLVASLPGEIVSRVYDLIIKQPSQNPYTTLVKRIQEEFQPTETEEIQKLLKGLTRGDKKPSLFLRDMRDLAKDRVGEAVLKELFLAQLPETLRKILVVIESASLETLAAAADRGWESSGLTEIASLAQNQPCTNGTQPSNTQHDSGGQMTEVMSRMVEVLDRFSRRESSRSPNWRRSRSQTPKGRSNSPRRPRSNSRGRNPKWKLCRYHFKFGDEARKCESWCERWNGKPHQENTSG